MKVNRSTAAITLFISLTCTGLVLGAKPKSGNVRGGVITSDGADGGGSDAVDGIAGEVQDDAAASSVQRRLGLKNKSHRKWIIQDKGKGKGIGRPTDKPDKGDGNGKGGDDKDSERKNYIVTFKKSKTLGKGLTKCVDVANGHKGTVGKKFSKVLDGCTMRLNPKEVTAIRNNPNIQFVEEDQKFYASEESPAASWGLDRINQAILPLDDKMTKKDAGGVKVYILDTGISGNHEDFIGVLEPSSASCHGDFVEEGNPLSDGNGHGTHVASTACGVTYGVSSNCKLCAVKVLSSQGSGSLTGVIAGIDHAAEDCDGSKRCVINMSLGGGKSPAINDAVKNAVEAGVHVVVAAGNSNDDACQYSPASEPKVITVGSTTSSDTRSSFSNYGTCVDIFAPGSSIKAAWKGSNTATKTISGTSMASPHIAGIAAFIAGTGNFTPDELTTQMKAMAMSGVVGNRKSGSPNLLATVSNFQGGTDLPTPSPTTPAPTTSAPTCVGNSLQVRILTDKYPEETSWDIVDTCTGQEIKRVDKYDSPLTVYPYDSGCIDQGKYTFTMSDSWGDGICCGYGEGSFSVFYNGILEVDHDGDFGTSFTKTFGSCAPPPTPNPVTPSPTESPTHKPTGTPTSPTPMPTGNPTSIPTNTPTSNPTQSPTSNPTQSPSLQPSANPTHSPTYSPTNNPTESPTSNPTESPTPQPTSNPTHTPTASPTNNPTASPTSNPTGSPTHSAAYNEGYDAGFIAGQATAQ